MRRFDRPVKSEAIPAKLPVVYSDNYVRYSVTILTVVFTLNIVDRQILSILMQPIKEEMHLSDTELGFLSGIAFALLYATLGIPIATLSSRYSRVNIITICLGIWSIMTVFSGMAGNFWQLLAARIGVGIGEAGGSPPSHSLIADYVSLEKRSTALGLFALGAPLGILFGFLLGGLLEQFYGWRAAFWAVGVPGLILMVILRFSLDEPPRGHSQGHVQAPTSDVTARQVLRHMWTVRSMRHLAVAATYQAFVLYGIMQWLPSFLHRSHQLASGEIGISLALAVGIGGAIGSIAGGYFADRLSRNDMRWQLWFPGLGAALALPFSLAIFLTDNLTLSLACLFVMVACMYAFLGPLYAMTQTLAPVRMRVLASAFMLFAVNIVGLGMGPQAIGIASDLLQPAYGEESLRYAMMFSSLAFAGSAAHFWIASRTLRQDIVRVVA